MVIIFEILKIPTFVYIILFLLIVMYPGLHCRHTLNS